MPLILSMLLAAQITPMQPMPKGTGLPLADVDTAAVMAPIHRLFAGMAARDPQALLAQLRPEGGATVAIENPDGTRAVSHMAWTEFADHLKPGPERYEERLTDPAVEVDGDIAMVWSPYTFLVDGKVHHCGVDHFDLVREAGAWKILNITWSQRTTGCGA
ncbi:MAG: nuclear transport factor 2 family protein [Sphingomonas sp.]